MLHICHNEFSGARTPIFSKFINSTKQHQQFLSCFKRAKLTKLAFQRNPQKVVFLRNYLGQAWQGFFCTYYT